MSKAVDIIRTAVEAIGIYAPGETMTDADAERGLVVLNNILDGWSNEAQACFAMLTQTLTLEVNKVSYTIGPSVSADVNAVRPLKIIQCYMTDTLQNNYPIAIVTQYEWNFIVNKQINGQIPTTLFYDPQDPIGILNFWPSPVLEWDVSFTSYLQLNAFANLSADVILPRGYEPALSYTLAVELCPFFGKVPHPTLSEMASRYLANIKRTNQRDIMAVYDDEIVARGGRGYSIFSDSFSGPRGGF